MANAKLTVVTDLGSFSRRTARTYTHIVVVRDERAEALEAARKANVEYYTLQVAKYRRVIETGQPEPGDSGRYTAQFLAEGKYAQWLASAEADLAKCSQGPIVEDLATEAGVLGWCGRLDLARKLAQTPQASRYRIVRIYDVETGKEVR